jgi:hypothetical protein
MVLFSGIARALYLKSTMKLWLCLLAFVLCWKILLLISFNGEFYFSWKNVTLYPYHGDNQKDPANKIFFLETSGRSRFNPRQWCAIESAARFSGLKEINVMVRSDHVDIGDNITRHILRELKNVHFYEIVPKKDFVGTPLEEFYLQGVFENSKFPSTHFSDALRMAYIYKVRLFDLFHMHYCTILIKFTVWWLVC